MEFKEGDIITYTCNRQRKVDEFGHGIAIHPWLDSYVNLRTLNRQFEDGDIQTIVRCGHVIYQKYKNLPKLSSGYRFILETDYGEDVYLMIYSGSYWYCINKVGSYLNFNTEVSPDKITKIYRPFNEGNPFDLKNEDLAYERDWKKNVKVEVTMQEIADKFGVHVENLKIIV